MANYDASIRVHAEVDAKQVETLLKRFNETAKAAGEAFEDSTDKVKQQEGVWEKLLRQADEYKSRLSELTSQGYNPGDQIYDEAYVGWQNAEYALKQYEDLVKAYLGELNKQTEAGKALAEIQDAAKVSNKDLVALLEQQKTIMERMVTLRKAGVGEGYQEYDQLAANLKQINKEIDRQRNGFKQAESSGKKLFSTIRSGSNQAANLLGSVVKKLSGMLVAALFLNQIRKAFQAMVSAAKEGFKNLAQYSQEYNANMSALTSSLAQIKNALAGAFEPVANIIIPYLTQMIGWLNVAIDKVAQFLVAISGSSTYTKAKKQTIDYAKSLDSASKSAKGALASFDELNVLNQNTGATSAGGGEATGKQAFETAQVNSDIQNAIDAIKDIMRPFIEDIAEWWNGLNFEPLLEAFDHLKAACEPIIGYIYEGLKFFLDEILLPIGSWVIEDGLPAFLEMVASGLEFLSAVIDAAKPGLSYIWEHVLKPIGEFTGEVFIWALNLISDALKKLAALMSDKKDEITTILEALGKVLELIWIEHIKLVLQFVMGALSELVSYIIDVVGDIIDILAGIIEFIEGVFSGDWEKAWEGLVKIFKGIVNGIIDIFEGVVNSIIEGLNKISIDIPDWVPPPFGGQKFGFDLEKLKLPRLARGMVIQGGQPFAAMLGDQAPGQVNIETPLQTMIEAFNDALDQRGGGAGGSYTFIAELDGEVIYRKTVEQDEIQYDASGRSGFDHRRE